jgi:Carboxypeptidase regulatory-like domain
MSYEMMHPSGSGNFSHLRKTTRNFIFLLTILFLSTAAAFCQLTTADIVGTVTDSTGAVVPEAAITLTNLATNETRNTVSNNAGDYDFALLPVGHYSILVKVKGFQESITKDLSVEAGDRARNDIHLQTGAETTIIEVTATTPLLQADNATVSSTVTAKAVQDLPLNGRNFVQLVALVPGANQGSGNSLSSGGRPDDRRTNAAGLSVNGQDESLNNWIVDGIDDNERVIGSIGVKPNIEGVQEITVQTNSYAPEAGRTAGGVIDIVTKSGSNQFHGSVYEYFRNDIFDGRNFFQNTGPKPELRQNQYGGSIGGPIFRDRTFFYFDYEGFRQVSGVTDTGTVPTLQEYNDINSIGPGNSPQALFSSANGTLQAYQGLIPSTGGPVPINPVALNYLKLFPAPTNSNISSNFTISPNKTQNANTYDARIDHKLNDKNLLFARFTYNSVDTFTPPAFGVVNGVEISGGRYNFDGPATDIAQQYELGYTHIFTPNFLMDLRAGFTRINNLSLPLNYGTGIDQKIGFPAAMTNFSPYANSLTPVSIGPFGDVGDGAYVPLQDIDNTFQYAGTVSWTKGNHNIKFGAALMRRQARNVQSASAVGAFSFNLTTDSNSTQLTQQNNQIASTLLGAYNSQTRNFNITPPDYRSWEPSLFAQDSWRLTSKLTVIYGLRYEVFTPFTEAHNRISNYDFFGALANPGSATSSALKIAGVNGVSNTAGIPTQYNNVAPRVGFAFAARPSTVIRGGYGLSYFPDNYTSNGDLKNAPFTSVNSPSCQSTVAVQIETFVNGGTLPKGQNPDCALQGQFGNLSQGILPPSAPTASQLANLSTIPGLSFVVDQVNFKNALIQQFNLQVEQQVGANVFIIGYVGNVGQHLPESINNVNQALPYNPLYPVGSAQNPVGGARSLSSSLPNLGNVSYLGTGGISNYNGLQASFQRRFTKGLAVDANYTWSKGLADTSTFSQQGDQGWSNANPLAIRQIEYGKADTDLQNRFALSLNYELQYGKEFTGFKKAALSGWQTNLIAGWQSGKVFSIVSSGSGADNPLDSGPAAPTPTAYGYNNRAVPQNANGADRPNTVTDPRLSHHTLTEFFNTSAFAPQPLGTVGNTQRNSMFGPHFRDFDLSLFKNFPITERVTMQFRVETFNISNTPNFYIANNNSSNQEFGNASFGQITATDPNYNPRQYQFVLKALF